MALKKTASGTPPQYPPEFWQQLARDFPFKGVDEEELRRHTEQWLTCASEILGISPISIREKNKP